MNKEKKIELLEKQLIRIQMSSGTRWPRFIRLHNWLRIHNRFYYWWHTTMLANPIHTSLVSISLFFVILTAVTCVIIALGFAIYLNTESIYFIGNIMHNWWETIRS